MTNPVESGARCFSGGPPSFLEDMKRCAVLLLLIVLASAPAGAAVRDRTRPRLSVSTTDGQFFLLPAQNPALEHAVRGTASDAGSGIKTVSVSFRSCAEMEGACTTQAEPQGTVNDNLIVGGKEVHCGHHTSSCSWSAPAPAAPGFYEVKAWAWDKARNRSSVRVLRIVVL
jgi:hypothetical protein